MLLVSSVCGFAMYKQEKNYFNYQITRFQLTVQMEKKTTESMEVVLREMSCGFECVKKLRGYRCPCIVFIIVVLDVNLVTFHSG